MEWDAAIDQYYDHARFYSAAQGRFVGLDPSGFGGGDADLYRYVMNAPTVNVDTTGRKMSIVPPPPGPIAPPAHYPAPPKETPPDPNVQEYDYIQMMRYYKYLQQMAQYYESQYNSLWWHRFDLYYLLRPNDPEKLLLVSYERYCLTAMAYYKQLASQWEVRMDQLERESLTRRAQNGAGQPCKGRLRTSFRREGGPWSSTGRKSNRCICCGSNSNSDRNSGSSSECCGC